MGARRCVAFAGGCIGSSADTLVKIKPIPLNPVAFADLLRHRCPSHASAAVTRNLRVRLFQYPFRSMEGTRLCGAYLQLTLRESVGA